MVVGPPLVEAIFAVGVLVAVAMLPLTCMAAADAMLTAARQQHSLSKAPSNCCFDAAGYDDSNDEDGSGEEEEAEAEAAFAAAPCEGLRQRVTAALPADGAAATQPLPEGALPQ